MKKALVAAVLVIGCASFVEARAIIPMTDPAEWQRSVMWSDGNSLTASFTRPSGQVTAGLTFGTSEERVPAMTVAASNNLEAMMKKDYLSDLHYAVQIKAGTVQGVVSGDQSNVRYLVKPAILNADSGSLELTIQGIKTAITHIGASLDQFGIIIDTQVDNDWTNIGDLSISI